MNKNLIFLAATLVAISSYEPAQALAEPAASAPAPTTAGCLLVSNLFAKRGTEVKDRTLALSSLYFFLGRIDDRTTTQQLKSDLQQQGHTINRANLVSLMNACLHAMQVKFQMLQSASQQLQKAK